MTISARSIATTLCILGITFGAWASFAESNPPESDADVMDLEVCGHLGAMRAARQALQDQDRETALLHLKAARDLLLICEKDAIAVPSDRIGRDII